jgi:hypothetical protein
MWSYVATSFLISPLPRDVETKLAAQENGLLDQVTLLLLRFNQTFLAFGEQGLRSIGSNEIL